MLNTLLLWTNVFYVGSLPCASNPSMKHVGPPTCSRFKSSTKMEIATSSNLYFRNVVGPWLPYRMPCLGLLGCLFVDK